MRTESPLDFTNFSIRAKSKFLAEEGLYDMSLDDLVFYSNFGDGTELIFMKDI